MTLTIELTPREEAALLAQAHAVGLEASEYARQLLAGEGDLQLGEAEEISLMTMLEDLKETGARIIGHLDKMNADTKEMIEILREAR